VIIEKVYKVSIPKKKMLEKIVETNHPEMKVKEHYKVEILEKNVGIPSSVSIIYVHDRYKKIDLDQEINYHDIIEGEMALNRNEEVCKKSFTYTSVAFFNVSSGELENICYYQKDYRDFKDWSRNFSRELLGHHLTEKQRRKTYQKAKTVYQQLDQDLKGYQITVKEKDEAELIRNAFQQILKNKYCQEKVCKEPTTNVKQEVQQVATVMTPSYQLGGGTRRRRRIVSGPGISGPSNHPPLPGIGPVVKK
jgi:hypothetical protein